MITLESMSRQKGADIMEKIIDLKMSIFELSRMHPEFVETMRELGFENITDPKMLNTAGRFMTVEKGAAMKNISLEKIRQTLEDKGFQVR
jgi:N-dimethylarginine dimethylaminohydrolase